MLPRNPHFAKLHSGYLFPEIAKKKEIYLKTNPNASLISLGIGDTTLPIPQPIVEAMKNKAEALGTMRGYTGYAPEQGSLELRQAIADKMYSGKISPDEIFISDGTKCDIGRLQLLFGEKASLAVQDPSYPAYIDTGVAMGMASHYEPATRQYRGIRYLPCSPENDFFPQLDLSMHSDLLYFCSPNNPTGAVATQAQLQHLVTYALEQKSLIIFDAAYSSYIQDPHLPRSIYDIPEARHTAIELGSFSKMAGFTGIRLGWSVVPADLLFKEGEPIQQDWRRLHTTFFNGASNIAQAGGIGALSDEGMRSIAILCNHYLENAALLKQALKKIGYQVYGGTHVPYLWVHIPSYSSWDAFELFLHRFQLVTTPGSGFGPAGEGFLRLSAFALRPQIEEAIRRLVNYHVN